MRTCKLGRTELDITPIGVGAWAIGGGDSAFGWGPQDDGDSIATIHHAVDLGLNWIDTAPVYGLGRSERVVGRALAELPPSRRPLVFTKCSLVWDERGSVSHNLAPESIRREVEASLKRLGIGVLDLCQVHWPSMPRGGASPGIEEAWATLAELQRAGHIRYLGVSNFSAAEMARVEPIAPIASLQSPYSMLSRRIERVDLSYCQAHDIGVLAYSPMQSGLLSGTMTRERIASLAPDDWRPKQNPEFQEPRLTRNLALVEKLAALGRRHGRSAGEVAIAWTLRHEAVTAAIVGARRPAQVDGFIGAAEWRLATDEVAEVESWLAA